MLQRRNIPAFEVGRPSGRGRVCTNHCSLLIQTDADYKSNLNQLKTTSRSAAARFVSYVPDKWSCNARATHALAAFRLCTLNVVVEGTNGVLEPAPRRHPYKFLDTIVRYVSERTATYDAMLKKWHSDGKLLSAYASAMYKESRNLHENVRTRCSCRLMDIHVHCLG